MITDMDATQQRLAELFAINKYAQPLTRRHPPPRLTKWETQARCGPFRVSGCCAAIASTMRRSLTPAIVCTMTDQLDAIRDKISRASGGHGRVVSRACGGRWSSASAIRNGCRHR
jgi:hypothetical protein